ncbi:hypothetical protein ACFZAM_08685 [Streptomyces sp. NPDC008079]|uniref:hypothetical protein n=1 Tax=Streptomyces sp. NPDC008079 TaxID=3364806 RepID=UPI0036E5DAC8
MPTTGYVYIPVRSAENLQIGVARGLWGWRSSALDRSTARSDIKSLKAGDLLFFGHSGPDSRVKPGGWTEVSLKRVLVAEVTRPLFTSTERVWPEETDGEIFPERIGIDVLDDRRNVSGASLGAPAMEKLRLSANKQCVAIVRDGRDIAAALAIVVGADKDLDAPDSSDELGHNGATDALVSVLARKEQGKLRQRVMGHAAIVTCQLCGRALPRRLVHAAHVKRRSAATHMERNNIHNAMRACVGGCDALFEYGYIYVDDTGYIQMTPVVNNVGDLGSLASHLKNRFCAAHNAKSAHFFAWHRRNVAEPLAASH